MTTLRRPLDDALIEAAIGRRAPGHASPELLADILAASARAPRVRAWPVGLPARQDRRTWVLLAAAALLIAGITVVVLGGGAFRPTPSLVPNSTLPAAVVPPPSAAASAPQLGPATPCATDTTSVSTGAAMPPTSEPLSPPVGNLDGSVYITQQDGVQIANVWAVRVGRATRIASIAGSDFNDLAITDVSPDGSEAILMLGERHGGLPRPACHDLWLLATDGSGATRLTHNAAQQDATQGRFSADGGFVAFLERDDIVGEHVGLIDLTGNRTPVMTACSSGYSVGFAWSPVDDRLIEECTGGPRLEMFANGQSTGSAAMPSGDEITMLLGWHDPHRVLLVTAENGTSINAPIESRTIQLSDNPGRPLIDRWTDPLVASPLLGEGDGVPGSLAPDGHAYAVYAQSGDFQTSGWYVVDHATGQAVKVTSFEGGFLAWSSDSQSVVYVHVDPDSNAATLMEAHIVSADARPITPLPADYRQGFWRLR
jgi:hypothetical protein